MKLRGKGALVAAASSFLLLGDSYLFWSCLPVLELPACFGVACLFWSCLPVLELPACFGVWICNVKDFSAL
jgi:hypothetical protein